MGYRALFSCSGPDMMLGAWALITFLWVEEKVAGAEMKATQSRSV